MSESPEQNPAPNDTPTGSAAQPPANPAPAPANPAPAPANPRPAPDNSAAQLLTQVHTAISALPEQIAKVLAEQNPRSAPTAKQEPAKQEPAKQEPAKAEPQKKTFAGWWFGQ